MSRTIFVAPSDSPSNVIRVDGLCYYYNGTSSYSINVNTEEILGRKNDCKSCTDEPYYELIKCYTFTSTGIWIQGSPGDHYKHLIYGCYFLGSTMNNTPPLVAGEGWVAAATCDDCLCFTFNCGSCSTSYTITLPEKTSFEGCPITAGEVAVINYDGNCSWSNSMTHPYLTCDDDKWKLQVCYDGQTPGSPCCYEGYIGLSGFCPQPGTYTLTSLDNEHTIDVQVSY